MNILGKSRIVAIYPNSKIEGKLMIVEISESLAIYTYASLNFYMYSYESTLKSYVNLAFMAYGIRYEHASLTINVRALPIILKVIYGSLDMSLAVSPSTLPMLLPFLSVSLSSMKSIDRMTSLMKIEVSIPTRTFKVPMK